MKISALQAQPTVRPQWSVVGGASDFAALLQGDDGALAFDSLGMFGHHGALSFRSGSADAHVGQAALDAASPRPDAPQVRVVESAGSREVNRVGVTASGPSSVADEVAQLERSSIELDAAAGMVPMRGLDVAFDAEESALVQRQGAPSRMVRKRREGGEDPSDLALAMAEQDGAAALTMRADGLPPSHNLERQLRAVAAEFGLGLADLRLNGRELASRIHPSPSQGDDHGHRRD